MSKKTCVAMLLAGGQGSRLGALTSTIAKPGLSFGGKYRIIDFSISNCANSNIDTVGVLTQYKPFLLNSYIGKGAAWDLDVAGGGIYILPPYMSEEGGSWYKGTANAIYQNIGFLDTYNPAYVLILSGDHIYKMDYEKMLQEHIKNKADLTVAVLSVTPEEASRFGIMTVGAGGQIIKFTEKPKKPDSTLASMGIYIFSWDVLRKALIEDEKDKKSSNDFGKDVIPKLLAEKKRLFAYHFEGYWKDVGTIESYYDASFELLSERPPLDIFDKSHKIFSEDDKQPPQYIGPKAEVKNCIISNGCIVLGKVENSILSDGVYIDEGVEVTDSIILPRSKIQANSKVHKAIFGENVQVSRDCVIGADYREKEMNITVIGNEVTLEKGSVVGAGEIVRR